MYVRTYHNVSSDFITRSTSEEFAQVVKDYNMRVLDGDSIWDELTSRGHLDRVCLILGLDREESLLALQLREQRVAREAGRSLIADDLPALWERSGAESSLSKA